MQKIVQFRTETFYFRKIIFSHSAKLKCVNRRLWTLNLKTVWAIYILAFLVMTQLIQKSQQPSLKLFPQSTKKFFAIFISPLFDIDTLMCFTEYKFQMEMDVNRNVLELKVQGKLERIANWLTRLWMKLRLNTLNWMMHEKFQPILGLG